MVQVEMLMEVILVMKVVVFMEMVVVCEVEGRPRWLMKIWPTPNIIYMNNYCYASSSFIQSSSHHHHRGSWGAC